MFPLDSRFCADLVLLAFLASPLIGAVPRAKEVRMTAHFELQPSEKELQKLAEQCWQEAPNKERCLEEEAFEAGEGIRHGDYSLANLEAIVRWKSERLVQVVIANSNTSI